MQPQVPQRVPGLLTLSLPDSGESRLSDLPSSSEALFSGLLSYALDSHPMNRLAPDSGFAQVPDQWIATGPFSFCCVDADFGFSATRHFRLRYSAEVDGFDWFSFW